MFQTIGGDSRLSQISHDGNTALVFVDSYSEG